MSKKKCEVTPSIQTASIHQQIKGLLKDDHLSYVLVTCKKAFIHDQMEVEMSYIGDPVLACYLVEDAQGHLQQDFITAEEMV